MHGGNRTTDYTDATDGKGVSLYPCHPCNPWSNPIFLSLCPLWSLCLNLKSGSRGRSIDAMRIIWAVLCVLGNGSICFGAMPEFDFRDAAQVKQWAPTHDLAALDGTAEGMLLRINGSDPYTMGPRDYPEGVALRATVRLRATESGTLEVFYFRQRAEPGAIGAGGSAGGAWTDVKFGCRRGSRVSFEGRSAGRSGECLIESIRLRQRM